MHLFIVFVTDDKKLKITRVPDSAPSFYEREKIRKEIAPDRPVLWYLSKENNCDVGDALILSGFENENDFIRAYSPIS